MTDSAIRPRKRSVEDNAAKHADACDSHFCPCYQEGTEVLASSHWEMLVWIARRSPDLLRQALTEVDRGSMSTDGEGPRDE